MFSPVKPNCESVRLRQCSKAVSNTDCKSCRADSSTAKWYRRLQTLSLLTVVGVGRLIHYPGLLLTVAVVGNNVLPLAGIGARHDGNDRIGVAHVKHFVSYAWLDEDEITGFIFN